MNVSGPGRPRAVGRQHSGIAGGSSPAGAFTLVEMLVVVSIILVVAVVALPAINSLSKTASRRSAVSLVMSALDQARAQAVSQSANVYFVFANGDSRLSFSNDGGKSTTDYRYRAFAIFQEVYIPPQTSTPSATPVQPYQLLPIRPWTLLPEGVSFRPDDRPRDDDKNPPARTILNKDAMPATPVEFYCQPANANLKLPFIKFNATGAIDEPTVAEFARVKLFEGYVTTNDAAITTNAAQGMADETIVLSLFTGRAKRQEVTSAAN